MTKDKLFIPGFCYILAANFLLFFVFYLLLPVLPFYLKEEFAAGKPMIGFTSYFFLGTALVQGVAFGTMFLAFNTLFVNLALNSQRGTATFTYLTSWDVGIGIGLLSGGFIAQIFGGFDYAYLLGALLILIFTLFFLLKAGPHFNKNELR